jgi:hypothetical protein
MDKREWKKTIKKGEEMVKDKIDSKDEKHVNRLRSRMLSPHMPHILLN